MILKTHPPARICLDLLSFGFRLERSLFWSELLLLIQSALLNLRKPVLLEKHGSRPSTLKFLISTKNRFILIVWATLVSMRMNMLPTIGISGMPLDEDPTHCLVQTTCHTLHRRQQETVVWIPQCLWMKN